MGSGELPLAPAPLLVSLFQTDYKFTMAVPECVKEKVGEMPDVEGMSKDDLAALVKKLYDQTLMSLGRSSTWSTPSRRGTWRSTTSRWKPLSLTAPSRSPSSRRSTSSR